MIAFRGLLVDTIFHYRTNPRWLTEIAILGKLSILGQFIKFKQIIDLLGISAEEVDLVFRKPQVF